ALYIYNKSAEMDYDSSSLVETEVLGLHFVLQGQRLVYQSLFAFAPTIASSNIASSAILSQEAIFGPNPPKYICPTYD
ncbi:11867_t:CDS:2, partial [Cetraspora pellucida]